jgi:RNA polymerase sigma factor (TIGR02999 family)
VQHSKDADITALLSRCASGDRAAADALTTAIYPIVRAIAQAQLNRCVTPPTIRATELAHESLIRLAEQTRVEWRNRSHYLAIVATVIRRVLIDYVRKRDAERRGAMFRFMSIDEITDQPTPAGRPDDDWLLIDRALDDLAAIDERQARLVELRFFMGMTIEEAASALDCSVPTMTRTWRFARAWLANRLDSLRAA